MADPRRRPDPEVSLAEFTQLMNATAHATLPCKGGTEWTSDDPVHQQRAADLCHACTLQTVCRAFAMASGVKDGTWGGLTALQRKKLRRRHREAA